MELERDVEELFAISHVDDNARSVWRYLPCGPFSDVAEHAAFLRDWQARPDLIVFTARDAATGKTIGSISLMCIRPEHGVAELGNIWYAPSAQRSRANTEACHLLLSHCFDELGYRRMEWKCNARNERSHRAALRLGFTFEGIFRQHMIVRGESRDTTWLSILNHEWPRIRAAQHRWLYENDSEPLAALVQADPGSL